MKRRMMALLLAGVMGVGMMSGCGSSKSADSGKVVREESDEPIDVLNQDEKMKLSIVCLQGYTQPDSEMQKWMEDRYNLDIDIIALPGWSDATSKISLLMGDETQRPDIIWWWNMEADYTKCRSDHCALLFQILAFVPCDNHTLRHNNTDIIIPHAAPFRKHKLRFRIFFYGLWAWKKVSWSYVVFTEEPHEKTDEQNRPVLLYASALRHSEPDADHRYRQRSRLAAGADGYDRTVQKEDPVRNRTDRKIVP